MRNLFKRNRPGATAIHSPAPGRLLRLDEVPDPVFSGRSLGDGFAVEPVDGAFAAPVDGQLILLADTLHAFAIRTADGAEILVHIGLDTVTLKGDGFTAKAKQGAAVRRGDVVVSCDLEQVAAGVPSMISPVILLNGTAFSITEPDLAASADDPVMTLQAR